MAHYIDGEGIETYQGIRTKLCSNCNKLTLKTYWRFFAEEIEHCDNCDYHNNKFYNIESGTKILVGNLDSNDINCKIKRGV